MEKDSCLIQVSLPDESLLILTQVEFERARRRGDTVLRNRLLRRKGVGEEIIEAMEVKHV
jgi:hypothetical protein